MNFSVAHLDCGYKGHAVLSDVNLAFSTGDVVCLLGPNGVGKTTLFKTMLGFLPPIKGEVVLGDRKRSTYSRREFAQVVAYVPQLHEPPFPFSVLDVVLTGCASRLAPLASPGKQEYEHAERILDELGIANLRDRVYTETSGGEQQMTLIARALLQDPQILVMDEPTAALDFGNQVRVLSTVKRLAEEGRGVVMTSHNPDHAFLCATRVALLTRDHGIFVGAPDDVVTEENLGLAYGVDVTITQAVNKKGATVKTCVPTL